MMNGTARTVRRPILTTAVGTNQAAFTPAEWLLFISISLIWGASFLFIALGLEAFHPGLITLLRVGSGALVLWLFPAARQPVERSDWPRVIMLSIVWVAAPFTIFPLAQQWVNSAVTGMLNGAMPIFAALVATALLKRMPRGARLYGLVLGAVGVVVIAQLSAAQGPSSAVGVALILVATLCYGVAVNVAAPLQQRYGALPVMARMLALASLWTAPYGLIGLAESGFSWSALVAVLAAGVLGTGFAYWIMGTLVGRVGSVRASFITYLIPVVALLLGVLLRGDAVSLLAISGVAIATAGALLACRREPRQSPLDATNADALSL